MTGAGVSAYAEDAPQDDCENRSFDNVYYLIDKKDFVPVSIFYQNIPVINSNAGFKFMNLEGQRDRITTYYDFDDLAILNANKELMSTLDDDLAKYFVEREQIKYIDKLTEPRNIIDFEVKNYNKNISSLDKHSLFGQIKRKERPILIEHLSSISESSPESISESLKIKSTENINFIILYGVTYGVITISHFSIFNFGVPNTSLLLKIEKINDKQTELTIDEKSYLESYFCGIDKNFQIQFPHIKSFSWFGYEQYNKLAVDNFPLRSFFRKYPEIYSIGQIISLSLIGFLLMYLILGRYSKFTAYRIILKKNKK